MAATTAAVVGAVAAVGGAVSQSKSAKDAAKAQGRSSDAGVAEQQRQFDTLVELLAPYVEAGTGAIGAQQDILGLRGADAQRKATAEIEGSPYFRALTKQGESAILQNASATGGLRGGNVQRALSEFRPNLLNNLIQQRFQNLSGLTQIGQASAAGQAAAGMETGANIASLLQLGGAAQAGGIIGQSKAVQKGAEDLIKLGGMVMGSGGAF